MPLLLTPRSPRGAAARLPAPIRRDTGTITIGRDPKSDVVIDHPSASSRHCAVGGSGAAWQIKDTSTNGTFVNGQRMTGVQPLRHGDVIGVADLEFAVAIAGGAAQQAGQWGQPATPSSPPAAASSAATARPGSSAEAVTRAAIDGIVRLNQTRQKARADLGIKAAEDANDPFAAGDGEAVLARLLAMPQPAAAAAVTRACDALAAHEHAMLSAAQATFRAALDHFSPTAIKQRAKSDADAWKAYERAFGAADGFVETFAQELTKAYRGAADK